MEITLGISDNRRRMKEDSPGRAANEIAMSRAAHQIFDVPCVTGGIRAAHNARFFPAAARLRVGGFGRVVLARI